MPTYRIKDTCPMWVTYYYTIEAESEEAAWNIFTNDQPLCDGEEIQDIISEMDGASDLDIEEMVP